MAELRITTVETVADELTKFCLPLSPKGYFRHAVAMMAGKRPEVMQRKISRAFDLLAEHCDIYFHVRPLKFELDQIISCAHDYGFEIGIGYSGNVYSDDAPLSLEQMVVFQDQVIQRLKMDLEMERRHPILAVIERTRMRISMAVWRLRYKWHRRR